jgi:hypothetical protein
MAGSYTFRNVARMEWIKLRTLRSVRWTLLFALAGMIGIGIAAGFNTRNPKGDVTNNILVGGALGSVLFAVLGVLVMTSEYSSGTIRATLAAIPKRPLVLAAKAAVWANWSPSPASWRAPRSSTAACPAPRSASPTCCGRSRCPVPTSAWSG